MFAKHFLVEFVIYFCLMFVVNLIVTYIWNLVFHDTGSVDWPRSIVFPIIWAVILLVLCNFIFVL
jgi:hypothetical protein